MPGPGDGRSGRGGGARSGRDVVRANPEDSVAADCEVSKALVGPK